MARARGNVADLRRWLDRMVLDVAPDKAALIHQKVHIQVSDGVIADTPVGNPDLWASPPPKGYAGGRARGSWQSSIGTPIRQEPGTLDASGAATASKGRQVAAQVEAGDVSYVASAVPYMKRLNEGWSSQAPAAFVERAVQRVAEQFN